MNFQDFIFVDLTHTMTPEMPTWNGSCGFELKVKLDYADCTDEVKFRVQKASMHAGVGTHMDALSHCIPGGMNIDEIALSELMIPAVMIDVSQKCHAEYLISKEDILNFEKRHGEIAKGSLAIIYTGWSRFWLDPKQYRNVDETGIMHFPSLSFEAAQLLWTRECVGIAVDTISPDVPTSGYPVHNLFLGSKKYIIENVANAAKLPPKGAFVIALPIKMQSATEAPIRMVGLIPNESFLFKDC